MKEEHTEMAIKPNTIPKNEKRKEGSSYFEGG